MQIKLKQGFRRAIRIEADTCVVAILDKRAGLLPEGICMINVKNEIRYILVTWLLERATEAGFLTQEELRAAKRLAWDKYRPLTVWES